MPGFQIGPVSFHFYGLILGFAILAAFITAKFQAKKVNFPQNIVDEAALVLIIPTILGARAYHVLDYWDYYWQNPAQIFYVWQGGAGIIGAIILGIATLYIFSRFQNLNFLKLTDLAAPSLALAQSIGRIGNFVNSEGFGPPTDLPWGTFIPEYQRPEIWANSTHFHPTFFYEGLGDFLIFLILFLFPSKTPGVKFALYLILYSTLRLGLEFFRIDTWQIGMIKVAQVIALVGFLVGLAVLVKVLKLKLSYKI